MSNIFANRRTAIIIGLVITILIIIAVVFVTPQEPINNSQNQQTNTNQITPISGVSPASKPQSYSQFLKGNRSQICTFSVKLEDGQTSNGTVYAAYGKIRGDFTIPTTEGTVQQHMLVDTYMAYMWTNVTNSGVKFVVQDAAKDQLTNNNALKCSEWVPSSSVFELPAEIVFTEISENTVVPTSAPLSP